MKRKLVIYGNTYEVTEYEKSPEKQVIRKSSRSVSSGCDLIPSPRRIDNLRAAKRSFVRRVSEHLKIKGAPLLLTFTLGAEFSSDDQWELVRNSFRNFVLRLRKDGYETSYVSVPEFQGRGALHLHVLMWGLPMQFGDIREKVSGRKKSKTVSVGCERIFRYLAALWERGFVDARVTDGSQKLAWYLGKYLTKSWSDRRFAGYRLVNYSHGFSYPQEYELADDVEFDKDILPLVGLEQVDEFIINTHWWGKITNKKYAVRM